MSPSCLLVSVSSLPGARYSTLVSSSLFTSADPIKPGAPRTVMGLIIRYLRFEVCIAPISFVYYAHRRRPRDIEGGIVPAHPSSAFRGIDIRHLVENLRRIFERLEPVGEILRNVKHAVISGGQFDAKPLFEGWRSDPKINKDIVDRTHGAAHNLHLAMRGSLIMHSPKRPALPVERDTAFHQMRIQSPRGKLLLRPTVRKEPAFILEFFQFDDECSLEFQFPKNHVRCWLKRSFVVNGLDYL